jgi:uncharacterized protein YbjT (DUF2867 family)
LVLPRSDFGRLIARFCASISKPFFWERDMPTESREFDIIVYGATGYTGRLVAEYLKDKTGLKWAMAGRSLSKLEEVRDLIGAASDTDLIVADASDSASLDAMAKRAKVVLTTVGPYQLYGNEHGCARKSTSMTRQRKRQARGLYFRLVSIPFPLIWA